jgi:hypothetical protein
MPFNLSSQVTNAGNGNATPPDPLLINTVQVGYTPTVTGNMTDNNRVVRTNDRNDLYFVDNQGNSVMLERNLPFHLTPEVVLGEMPFRVWDKTKIIQNGLDPEDPANWSFSIDTAIHFEIRHKEIGLMQHLQGEVIQIWLYKYSKNKSKKRNRDRNNHTIFSNVKYPYSNKFVHPQNRFGFGGTPPAWTGSASISIEPYYSPTGQPFNEGQFVPFFIDVTQMFRIPTGVNFPLRADDYLNAGIEPRGRKKSKPKPTRFSAAVIKFAFVIPNYRDTNKPLWLGESDAIYIYPKMKKFLNTTTNEVERWAVQWQIDIGKRTM